MKDTTYEQYDEIDTVFGGPENPFTKTTIVFGYRGDWNSRILRRNNSGQYVNQYVIGLPYDVRIKENRIYRRLISTTTGVAEIFPG